MQVWDLGINVETPALALQLRAFFYFPDFSSFLLDYKQHEGGDCIGLVHFIPQGCLTHGAIQIYLGMNKGMKECMMWLLNCRTLMQKEGSFGIYVITSVRSNQFVCPYSEPAAQTQSCSVESTSKKERLDYFYILLYDYAQHVLFVLYG